MGLKLFDGDEEADIVNLSEIKIDEEFARRYEHNKKREDLQRYEELKKKGLIEDSESESESELSSGEEDPSIANRSRKHDIEFFKVLNQVRNQDPHIYQKDVTFFEPESDSDNKEEEGEVKKEKKKKKHEHLKDIQARMLIEEGPEFDDTEPIMEKKSYHEEQEELKKAFLNAVKDDENDDEGDFLKVKDKSENQESEDDDGEFEKKLNEYFGKEEQLDKNSKYLKDFFMKKMWLDKEDKDKTSFVDDDDMDKIMEDEEEIERQEKYEESYNFRHEEGVGDRVMGHSRKVEGSVRKKDNARKEQRKNKEERQKVAEMERNEELKHLKNLKKKEMKEKMKKVLEAAGMNSNDDCPLELDDLEDDFDPEEYDKMMKKAFGQKYYGTEDVDPSFGASDDDEGCIEKPDFDKEDELLGLPKGWDVPEEGDGFLVARNRVLKRKADGDEHDEQSVEEEDNREENSKQSGGKRKRKMSFFKKVKEELMEEYYKLDYEDTIGDLKTRFKYAKVEPKKYGLKTEDILTLDDKELNQYVPIKKLAPYRETEWKVRKNKRHVFINSKQLMAKQYNSKTDKRKKRPKHVEDKSASVSDSDQGRKAKTEESDVSDKLSRRAKRRRRQAQLKLSNSRLFAYGKI